MIVLIMNVDIGRVATSVPEFMKGKIVMVIWITEMRHLVGLNAVQTILRITSIAKFNFA